MSQKESTIFNPSHELRMRTLKAFAFGLDLPDLNSGILIDSLLSGKLNYLITDELRLDLKKQSNTDGELAESSFNIISYIGASFISGSKINPSSSFLIGRWVLHLAFSSDEVSFKNAGMYAGFHFHGGTERFQSKMVI